MAISLRGLHPAVRERAQIALNHAARYNVAVTVTSSKRTRQEQTRLYDAYRRGVSRWPANRPGDSAHEYGLAWDSVVGDRRLQGWWNAVRQAVGFSVPRNDVIHAEVPNWRQAVGRLG